MRARNDVDSVIRQLERELGEEISFLEREDATTKPRHASAGVCPSGSPSPQVRWLQQALNQLSAFGLAENGVFSVPTRRALQNFQAEQGLVPTGKMGPRTRAALVEASGILPPRTRQSYAADMALGEMEVPAPGDRCPIDSPTVIRGFGKYDDFLPQLPREQQDKLAALASEIAHSQSETSPVTQVIAIGHADLDASIEARYPGFLEYVSEKRAHAVLEDLNCRFIALTSNTSTPSKISGRDWVGVGRGARALAISAPRTESERKCNRRVEVVLVRSTRFPQLSQPSNMDMLTDSDLMVDLYHAALQGTSGQYERPHIAIEKASEIAEKALKIVKLKLRERATRCPALPDLQGFTPFFKDALQGTASKYSDTDVVVERAAEIADYAGFKIGQAQHRLEWKFAQLPQPMSPDCEIVRGKVAGPANHMLCGPHGHILDTTTNTVIAHDLAEYRQRFPR